MISNLQALNELKNELKDVNSLMTYNMSVKQRMEQELKYVGSDNCSIMMSAIDKIQLREIHVPMCLDKELSLAIIDCSIKHTKEEIKRLKGEATKLRQKIEELEKKL